MTGFGVAAADLRAHAGKVEGHAAKLGQAVEAAGHAMSNGTYGVICQFLPPLFNEVEQIAKDALVSSQEGLHAVAENLRTTAEVYENQDQAAGMAFRGIEDGMR